MTKLKIIIRLIVAPLVISVIFASLALGLVGGGVFSSGDRAYFGFGVLVALAICGLGFWMLARVSRREREEGNPSELDSSQE
jgi:hypothetical protein